MDKLESVLVSDTHKILKDFEIQMDCLFPAWRLDIVLEKKKKKKKKKNKKKLVVLCILPFWKIKENEKIDKYMDVAKEFF